MKDSYAFDSHRYLSVSKVASRSLFVSLYHEPHSANAVFGRRRRRTSLAQIISKIIATAFKLVKPVYKLCQDTTLKNARPDCKRGRDRMTGRAAQYLRVSCSKIMSLTLRSPLPADLYHVCTKSDDCIDGLMCDKLNRTVLGPGPAPPHLQFIAENDKICLCDGEAGFKEKDYTCNGERLLNLHGLGKEFKCNARNYAAVKLVTKASQWRNTGTRRRRRKARGGLYLRIASSAGN
ncbi:hypothetical protein EVAR_22664_1 [Eumeta japonica]|uniref:Uncharacterized protein n=1 Tax=Eumeta variegata TaxID=151549 RepID=A0A4C1VJH5_EUMVA|nr:hypothetical protein EVAR_22664_1 [Eumeta japonica]